MPTVTHDNHDERLAEEGECPDCDEIRAEQEREFGWMAGAVRRNRLSSDERAAIEADTELMLDEFHGRGLDG